MEHCEMKINNCPFCDKKPNVYQKTSHMYGFTFITDVACHDCEIKVNGCSTKIVEIWNEVFSYINRKQIGGAGWSIECNWITLYYALLKKYEMFPRECKTCVRFHKTDHMSTLWHQDDELIKELVRPETW